MKKSRSMRVMRILVLLDGETQMAGSVAAQVLEQTRYWRYLGHAVTVVEHGASQGEKGLWRRLWSVDADVVLSVSGRLRTMALGWLVAQLRRWPWVADVTMEPNRNRRDWRWWAACFLRSRATQLVVTGVGVWPLRERRVAVVPDGLEVSRLAGLRRADDRRRELGIEDHVFVLGGLAAAGREKGWGTVLQAADLMRNLPFLFAIGGEWEGAGELMELAAAMSLRNVRFLPASIERERDGLWSLCDAALSVAPDDAEMAGRMPIDLLEAMAAGLPILGLGRAGVALETVEKTGNGIWVPAGDAGELVRTIMRMGLDTDRVAEWRLRGREQALLHSRERQALEMLRQLWRAALSH